MFNIKIPYNVESSDDKQVISRMIREYNSMFRYAFNRIWNKESVEYKDVAKLNNVGYMDSWHAISALKESKDFAKTVNEGNPKQKKVIFGCRKKFLERMQGKIIPSYTNLGDGNGTMSKWKYMTFPYLLRDESKDWTNEDDRLKWYEMQTYDTNIDCSTNVPKYLRIYSDVSHLIIYDNIKHFNDYADVWYLEECYEWTYTYSSLNNSFYYERELYGEDLELLRY